MKLWLARHAPALVAEGLCYGALDVAADAAATGHAARELALRLPRGLAVAVSPLRRCLQLDAALRGLRPDLAATCDGRLREMDFGAWEGRPWDAVHPAEFAAWMADFAGHRCGGGESVADLMARVAEALGQARESGRDMLWITHAGVARAVHLLTEGVALPRTPSEWPRAGLACGAVACIDLPGPAAADSTSGKS